MYISLKKLQESTLGMIVFLIVGKRWVVTKVSNQSGNEELKGFLEGFEKFLLSCINKS